MASISTIEPRERTLRKARGETVIRKPLRLTGQEGLRTEVLDWMIISS
jgi:hypothetical protein